jgi:hypothetical protein
MCPNVADLLPFLLTVVMVGGGIGVVVLPHQSERENKRLQDRIAELEGQKSPTNTEH